MKKEIWVGILATLIVSLTAAVVAKAETFRGDWIEVDSASFRTVVNAVKGGAIGNSSDQAASAAEPYCSKEISKLQKKGMIVLAYRLTAQSTSSPYVFSGSCDIRYLDPALITTGK